MPKSRLQFRLAELVGWTAVIALELSAFALCGWDAHACIVILGVSLWVIAAFLARRFSLHFSNRTALVILAVLILAGVLSAMLFPAVR
jgi:hypothetical protein